LFLEGLEVPVISAQVTANVFAPAAAAIQVVPLPEVLQLKARTMVHLFFLEEPSAGVEKAGRVSLADLRAADGGDTELSDSAYKLLFSGEFAGFSYVKTPINRAVVLQCLDFSSYWDFLQATMMDYGPQGNAFVSRGRLYASNEALFANVPTQSQGEQLRAWILSKPQTPGLTDVKGLAGGIIALMEIMGGLRNHSLGVNDFFTIAELRAHLLSQIVAEDNDSTAQNVLSVQVFWKWLYNDLQGQSGQISLRDMFKLLCQYVYYQVVPNPVAKFDPSFDKKPVKVPPHQEKLLKSPFINAVRVVLQNGMALLQSAGDERLPGPTLSTYSITVRDEMLPKMVSWGKLYAQAKSVSQYLESLAALASKNDQQNDREVVTRQKTALLYLKGLRTQIEAAFEQTVDVPGSTHYVSGQQRLRTQIFRPDCYMAAPPTCNVIFPEQYTQITYDRSLIDETTRVAIFQHSMVTGQDYLTANQFLQPSLRNETSAAAKVIKDKWRVLMDHELHTGIVAREEWLPDSFANGSLRGRDPADAKKLNNLTITWTQRVGLHHFFKYRIGPRTLNGAGRFMPYLACGFPALVINEPFYLRKLGAGEDPVQKIRGAKDPARELGAPPQFLGMVEGISHSIGQDGGSTTFSLSHVRNHLGIDDEFVGSVVAKTRESGAFYKTIRYVVSLTEAKKDKKLLQFLRDCTPQNAAAVGNTDLVTAKRYLTESELSYSRKAVKDGVEILEKKKVAVKKPVEVQVPKDAASREAATNATTETTSMTGKVIKVPTEGGRVSIGSKGFHGGTVKLIEVFGGYKELDKSYYYDRIMVYETVAVPTGAAPEDVPFEYAVQPTWLSSSYDNNKVGKQVYQKFFGCGSIVDDLVLEVGPVEQDEPDGVFVMPGEETEALKKRLRTIEMQKGLVSIEKAVNLLAFTYGKVRLAKLDVDEFVETYTRRPVATKRDLLGSYDLVLKVSGSTVSVVKGAAGFHTFSVHEACVEQKNLCGLTDNAVLARMGRSQAEALKASYDVRWQKLARVKEYRLALKDRGLGFVG